MQRFLNALKHLFFSSLSLVATGLIGLGLILIYFSWHLPNVSRLKHVDYRVPLMVYARDHQLIAEYGEERRIPVSFSKIPKPLIDAVLATEDKRFYEHSGVDILGLIRASIVLVTTGKKLEGASTITMQVARNFFLTRKKTYVRKIKEILLALKIDQTISKQRVLSLYFNKIYFGNHAYGIAAAAFTYYGKTLAQLTLPQMAMLAGLPKAPSANNPLQNPTRAKNRRDHVLWRMWQTKYISKQRYQKAIQVPITASYHYLKPSVHAPYVAEMVRAKMFAQYGSSAYTNGFKVYTTINPILQKAATTSLQQGLIAYSLRHGFYGPVAQLGLPNLDNLNTWQTKLQTYKQAAGLKIAVVLEVDPNTQSAQLLRANGDIITLSWQGVLWAKPFLGGGWSPLPKTMTQVLTAGDVVYIRKYAHQWQLAQWPKEEGALISLNPQNGEILALSGGFNFDKTHYNRVTQAARQLGSSFKPFIYSAALHKGYTLASTINDAPIVKSQLSGENTLWRPHNDTEVFYGPTRLRVGLMQSRNLVSIRLLQAIGVHYALHYIKRFGFDVTKLPHSLSLALGSGSLTPYQLAEGYTIFANGGFKVPAFLIRKITHRGKLIYQATPVIACNACNTEQRAKLLDQNQLLAPRVISAQNAYLMDSAMQSVIRHGTGRGALVLHRHDLGGKTGTTNNQMDAWFAGFNPHIVTVVWVGYDHPKSLYEYGAQAALPIWIDYMKVALASLPKTWLPEPPGIVSAKINPHTGLAAAANDQNAIYELFRSQYLPQTASETNQPTDNNLFNDSQTIF